MSATDASSLSFWELVATIGFICVIIGVAIEGVEHFSKETLDENLKKRRKNVERFGWLIVVLSLATEFFGDHKVKGITTRETQRMTVELTFATTNAAIANERSIILEKTNLVLRTEMLKLELALRDREIKPEQYTNLVEILRQAKKGPVSVQSDFWDSESRSYANQIKSILTDAGFEIEKSQFPALTYRSYGVLLFIADTDKAPEHAISIQRAFGTIGEYMSAEKPKQAMAAFLATNSQMVVIWVARKRYDPGVPQWWK
jgi:hypothetical protein